MRKRKSRSVVAVVKRSKAKRRTAPKTNPVNMPPLVNDYEPGPDAELELRPEVAAYLEQSLREFKQGKRGIPIEEVARALGLKWPPDVSA